MIARCTYDRLFRQQEICVTIPNFLPFGYNNNAAFIESIRTVKKNIGLSFQQAHAYYISVTLLIHYIHKPYYNHDILFDQKFPKCTHLLVYQYFNEFNQKGKKIGSSSKQ